MWKNLLLFPVVFICSVIIVSLSVWNFFHLIHFFHSFSALLCVCISTTQKTFNKKNFKKIVYFNKFAPCVSVCVCVCEWPLLLSPNFFLIFFPEFRAEETKRQFQKKKFFSTGEENSADHLHKQFFIGTRGGPAVNYLKKKTTDLHEIKQ